MNKVAFAKYHALENDFIVLEATNRRLPKPTLSKLAVELCDRRKGIGADGVLYLSKSKKADRRIDIYNADGSWAEKSGNGLRIAAMHLAGKSAKAKQFALETATSIDTVALRAGKSNRRIATATIGEPDFHTNNVPVKTRSRYLINAPLNFGPGKLPVTCLSVGNPHAVLLVDNFDFDWPTIGHDIEHAKQFPEGANVEFVQVISRKKIRVAVWERGAGATGSSGTGAAASVATMVTLGLVDRQCEVVFDSGSITVHWRKNDNRIELIGPVVYIGSGTFIRP